MAFSRILILICSALFAILGLYLIAGKRRSKSNNFLGLFFFLWALNFLDAWLLLTGFYHQYPFLALWEDGLIFLHGPVIYFYVRSLVQKKSKKAILDWLHTIPFLIVLILSFFFFHLQSTKVKLHIINAMTQEQQPLQVIIPLAFTFLHIFIYIFLSKKLLQSEEDRMDGYYSSKPIQWFNTTLNLIIGILILSFTVSSLQYFDNPIFFQIAMTVLNGCILIFIVRIYFQTMDEPKLFDSKKYIGSQHSKDEIEVVAERIKKEVEQTKLYLNPEITIDDLSKTINIESRMVSQAINTVFGKNFFDYINSYRIEEAKKAFDHNSDKKLTVLEVMYSVGFNSKSSFNTQFKKKTGLTPSQYKNKA